MSKLKGPTSYYAGLSAHHFAGQSDVFTKLLLSPSASAASCLFGYQSQNVFPDQPRPVSIMRGAERRVSSSANSNNQECLYNCNHSSRGHWHWAPASSSPRALPRAALHQRQRNDYTQTRGYLDIYLYLSTYLDHCCSRLLSTRLWLQHSLHWSQQHWM